METEEQDGGQREGLPLSFYERWESSTVDEKLVLAREAASHPGFDEEDAFEVGSRLEESLEAVGRFAELESVLDVWKQRAPRVHDAEPAVRTWRVELALRLPGGDVKGGLVSLGRRTGGCAPVTPLARGGRGRIARGVGPGGLRDARGAHLHGRGAATGSGAERGGTGRAPGALRSGGAALGGGGPGAADRPGVLAAALGPRGAGSAFRALLRRAARLGDVLRARAALAPGVAMGTHAVALPGVLPSVARPPSGWRA